MPKSKRKMVDVGGAAEISKWDNGVSVSGVLIGKRRGGLTGRDGKKSLLMDIMSEDGDVIVTYPMPAILENRLADVPLGTFVAIECLGKIQTRGGADAWNFRVQREDTPHAETQNA